MRQALARGALACAAAVLALCVAELALRWRPVVPTSAGWEFDTDNEEEACVRPSATRGWSPVPGRCGRGDLGTRVTGSEAADAAVLLVLGDSIAAQHSWVASTSTELNLSAPTRVHNAGVSGYDPCHALYTWQEIGPRLRPQRVLLQLCPNDLMASSLLVPEAGGQQRYLLGAGGGVTRSFTFPGWVLRSQLATTLTLALGPSLWAQADRMGPWELEAAVGRCVGELDRQVRSAGAELTAALFPALVDVGALGEEGRSLADEARLERLVLNQGVPLLNLRGALGPELVSARAHPHDLFHPSHEAQRALGAPIAAWLGQQAADR